MAGSKVANIVIADAPNMSEDEFQVKRDYLVALGWDDLVAQFDAARGNKEAETTTESEPEKGWNG